LQNCLGPPLFYSGAVQPVCTVHPRVHRNMRVVHHYERVHKAASQTCHTKQILFTKSVVCKHQTMSS